MISLTLLDIRDSSLAPLILPGIFILICLIYYGGTWFYRMRVRGGRMSSVAQAVGGAYRAGFNQPATDAIPQFQGTQLRLARAAYNIVTTTWTLHSRPCQVWMGDAGSQFNKDPLVEAVGGDNVAGFIAVECPFPHIRRAVMCDRALRIDEQSYRHRLAATLWSNLLDHVQAQGLLPMSLGIPDLDEAFDIRVESAAAFHTMFNRNSINMLDAHPGHLWIQDGVILLEYGDRIWSPRNFIDRARWLKSFIEAWDDSAESGSTSAEHSGSHRLL